MFAQFFRRVFSERFFFFFQAQAVEEALRKDRDCPAEKETPKKEKGGGKRPRRFAAPSAWPGNVFEFAFS